MSAALTISMHDSAPNRTILYLNGVTVSFDGFKALNNLSLVIEEGELRAIIGPNGAGKSTMMDVITGLTKPDSGEVIFQQNIDLTRHDEAHIANLGIGRKFQKPSCIGSLTVHDNLDLALRGQRRLFSALLRKRSAQQLQRIDELLELVAQAQRAAVATHRRAAGAGRAHPAASSARQRPLPWPEAVAGDRHAAGAGSATAAGR